MVTQDFINKFNGLTEPYFFYNGTVELRYEPNEHVYYLLKDGQFIPQEGVTTVCHIIDKSNALIPWAAKVTIEKLLKTVPRTTTDVIDVIPEMSYAEFEALALAAKSAHKDKLEEAADVGHQAHAWIEDYIKRILGLVNDDIPQALPEDERTQSCCKAALDWMHKHNVRWKCTERKIYSLQYGYAGTMDGLAIVDSCDDPLCCPNAFKDRLSVIDWKSSNYLYIEYLIQTAAYMMAYIEETSEDVQDRWIIRLGKADGQFEAWHSEGKDEFWHDFGAFTDALELYRAVHVLEDRVKNRKNFIKDERKKAKNEEKERVKAAAREAKEAEKAAKKAAREQARAEKKNTKKAKKEEQAIIHPN